MADTAVKVKHLLIITARSLASFDCRSTSLVVSGSSSWMLRDVLMFRSFLNFFNVSSWTQHCNRSNYTNCHTVSNCTEKKTNFCQGQNFQYFQVLDHHHHIRLISNDIPALHTVSKVQLITVYKQKSVELMCLAEKHPEITLQLS